jgi:predicted enzyme related to lactoylglutathione lyase
MNTPTVPQLRVTEIAFTGYPVTEMARARAFYEGVLGLKPSTTFGEGEKQWVEYDVGAATLAVTNFAAEWTPSSHGPSAALEVEDFDAAIGALRAAGVRFMVPPTDSPVCRMAVVLDPDGNSLAIHRRHAH